MYHTVTRLFFYVLAIIFGFIAILLVVLPLAANRPSGERYIKNLIQSQAEKYLDCRVRIGSLKTNILTRIQLNDIALYREGQGKIIPFLEIGRAEARYSLLELLHKRLTVNSLAIDRMTAHIVRDSSGVIDTPHLKKTGAPSKKDKPGSILFSLNRISLLNSYASYQDRKIHLDAELWKAGSVISRKRPNVYSLEFNADSLL
ncbi:MAG: hypothetical protein WCU00_04775, partial [Candidatus Latescibacterota bacterium]